ncbi:helix-turn-helix transcriptional regulator [Clostridium sp. YIM B02569]|uniref:helix-turn-helix domain-containing protein n=1 Tax=Clostridium sp. YIM B02569 TaxID=2911967 RepID=UPI001EEB88A4|nr:helix-turn-helix transcriptional regulator [Clostridium sp. YIM B02569]
MNEKMLFKNRLLTLRKEKGLTQYELADKLGFSRGQVGNYEQGSRQPDQETLVKIADFFGVSVDYLLGRADIIAPDKQQKSNLAEQFALKLIEQLEKDGYTITEEDLPNLILAAKITLAQNKKKSR